MKAADASAGVIKSGGKTRRAAKMVILDTEHPDILDFVRCKVEEEAKAWALIDAGYDSSLDGPAYGSVFFQNANNSVRASDEFMQAVENDEQWQTRYVMDGAVSDTMPARELMREIAHATHICGDPGMQFDSTINGWHTCPNTGRINASNPCSEYMHLDDSACNLASLNLLKFANESGEFDSESFRHAVDVLITAQDILVDNSSYPTDKIGETARAYRELGLGYANLGALLMSLGIPYDSEAGRQYAAAVTALMCGEAYAQSARLAAHQGPFEGYEKNSEPMLKVIGKHRSHAYKIDPAYVPLDLLSAARGAWDDAYAAGQESGFRNSQATVLAPTGTIAFMMDCDTTGVEPDIALVKYKKLVGGGMLKIVNSTVPRALRRLGYESGQIQDIIDYIDKQDTIEGAEELKDEDLPVFDCAFTPANGQRSIHHLGHLRMMGAVAAVHLRGNLEDDQHADRCHGRRHHERLPGSVAVRREGGGDLPRRVQTDPAAQHLEGCRQEADGGRDRGPADATPLAAGLPVDCGTSSISPGTRATSTSACTRTGRPGEIFIKIAKEGSTISGLMDTIGILTSMALQYGVPLDVLVNKFSHVRFEPSGFTKNPEIPIAKSLIDYMFRFIGSKFLDSDGQAAAGIRSLEGEEIASQAAAAVQSEVDALGFSPQSDAPSCADCGAIMIRNGSCYKCLNCGATSGCS